MKVNHPKIPTFLFFLGITILIFSCEKTEELLPQPDSLVLKEAAEVNAVFDETDMFSLSAMQSFGLDMRTQLGLESDYCESTKVNFLPNQKMIVINFGEECTSPRGVVRKGKIMLSYSAMSYESGSEISISFDGYEVNGKKIEGRRRLIHRGFSTDGNFFTLETVISDGKVTWPDGTFATIEGEHIKKLYLPTINRGFKIEMTGGAGGTTRLKVDYMALIEEQFVFNQSCTEIGNWIPSSGILSMTYNTNTTFLINYGVGECDKFATVTYKELTFPINFD